MISGWGYVKELTDGLMLSSDSLFIMFIGLGKFVRSCPSVRLVLSGGDRLYSWRVRPLISLAGDAP